MTSYVGAFEQDGILAKAVVSAQRSNDLSVLRYQEGFSDYQRVLNAQQSLFVQQGRYVDNRGAAGRSMLSSTIIGGIGAVIAWQILSIRPSLLVYTLVVALFALLVGPRIFQGAGMHPQGSMWSYGYLTMIVVLAPAVMDGVGSDGASSAFYMRLFLFVVVAVYGSIAVAVFDAFWPRVMGVRRSLIHEPSPA